MSVEYSWCFWCYHLADFPSSRSDGTARCIYLYTYISLNLRIIWRNRRKNKRQNFEHERTSMTRLRFLCLFSHRNARFIKQPSVYLARLYKAARKIPPSSIEYFKYTPVRRRACCNAWMLLPGEYYKAVSVEFEQIAPAKFPLSFRGALHGEVPSYCLRGPLKVIFSSLEIIFYYYSLERSKHLKGIS